MALGNESWVDYPANCLLIFLMDAFYRSSSEWWFGCDRAPIRDCGDRQFETRSLQKEQATVVLTKYDEAGNESLDVSAGDDQ